MRAKNGRHDTTREDELLIQDELWQLKAVISM